VLASICIPTIARILQVFDVAAKKGIDLDTWLDAQSLYQSNPKKVKRAIRKLVNENWRSLSGYDWKLIRRFREEAKQKVVVVD